MRRTANYQSGGRNQHGGTTRSAGATPRGVTANSVRVTGSALRTNGGNVSAGLGTERRATLSPSECSHLCRRAARGARTRREAVSIVYLRLYIVSAPSPQARFPVALFLD